MKKTIYILVGPQGSGKTYWAKNVLLAQGQTSIVRISQDEQGRGGHLLIFRECIKSGKSMVIDRMNFNREQRDKYAQVAWDHGYDRVLVLFDIDRDICLRRLATRRDHPTIKHDSNHSAVLDFYFEEFVYPCFDEYDEMLTIRKSGQSRILDMQNRCYNKRVIVVGDIHGCFDEFMGLLKKCEYRAGDIVVATGDLVDRGPKVRKTLLWFRNTSGAYSVEGNHDSKYRRYLTGNPVKITNGLDCTLEQCGDFDPVSWAAWFQSLPQIIRLRNIRKKPMYVVHAGVDGRVGIDRQKTETCLYARHLDGKGFFDIEGGVPWWDTLDGSCCVLSGHITTKRAQPHPSVYCLDGGAYQGGTLRALVIEDDSSILVEVDCSTKENT